MYCLIYRFKKQILTVLSHVSLNVCDTNNNMVDLSCKKCYNFLKKSSKTEQFKRFKNIEKNIK